MSEGDALRVKVKKLSVKFIGGGDELQQIVHTQDVAVSRPKRAAALKVVGAYTEEKVEAAAESSDSDDEDQDAEIRNLSSSGPSKALMAGNDLGGGAVYSFQTPKGAKKMAQLAAQSAEKQRRRPRRLLRDSDDSESSSDNGEDSDDSEWSNAKADRGVDSDSSEASVPKRRKTRTPAKQNAKTPSKKKEEKGEKTMRLRKRTKKKDEAKIENMAEDYFIAHSGDAPTSDHTLSRLGTPQMDQYELNFILQKTPNSHVNEKRDLYKSYQEHFSKWMYQLSNGFNLLLYGLGSKRQLMENFRLQYLEDYHHIVINGFFPSLSIKQILNSITEDVLELKQSYHSMQDQVDFIKDELEDKNEPLFLVIHNIDGSMLRGSKNHVLLSSLAQMPCVHILASMDHINAPLIWDQSRCGSFNWLWYDTTTYQAYIEETSYENSLLVQQSGALALSSLNHVLRSITPNARGIFNILVDNQLEHKDDLTFSGISFQELYQKCREAFLINSDLTLRAQLTEFRDHKLLVSKKGIDGAELLSIPLDHATLQEFKQQEEIK